MDDTTLILLISPLAAIQLGLQIFALYDLYRRKEARNLPVAFWVAIILLGNLLGTILYFVLGRVDEDGEEST